MDLGRSGEWAGWRVVLLGAAKFGTQVAASLYAQRQE